MMDYDEDDIPLPAMTCGHPLAARAVRYWNERLTTVCWVCAIEGNARALYGLADARTMTMPSLASVGISGRAAGVPIPPRPARPRIGR
jgi:hypothetical protein